MSDFEARRLARAAWPVRKVRLGEEELVDSRDDSSVDDRVALVWTLTVEQWAAAGRPIPDYARAETPGRVVRRASARAKDVADAEVLEEILSRRR